MTLFVASVYLLCNRKQNINYNTKETLMFRGFTQFVCDDCGHKFTGPDMELMCTVYTAPVKCPKCGGWHTYPSGFHVCLPFGGLFSLNKRIYRRIWKSREETV